MSSCNHYNTAKARKNCTVVTMKNSHIQVKVFLPLTWLWVLLIISLVDLPGYTQAAPRGQTTRDAPSGSESIKRICKLLGSKSTWFRSCSTDTAERRKELSIRETCRSVRVERKVNKIIHEGGETINCSARVTFNRCHGQVQSTMQPVPIEIQSEEQRPAFRDLISTSPRKRCCISNKFQTNIIQLHCSRYSMTVPFELSSAVTCAII